jgi:hypothetical protein
MRKLMLIGVGLLIMTGFLPAKVMKVQHTVECFITTCGTTTCYDSERDLTHRELLNIYDSLEEEHCG